MSDISEQEWQLLREHYGDLAYEEPHNHRRYLAAIREFLGKKEDDLEE